VDAVQAVAENIITYMNSIEMSENNQKSTKNKGEWTELLVFVNLLSRQKVFLSNSDLTPKADYFDVTRVTTNNLNLEFMILDSETVESRDKVSKKTRKIDISKVLTHTVLNELKQKIIDGSATFDIPSFEVVQNELGFTIIKGGTSNQKADIVLDIIMSGVSKTNEGFGIKSYLGNKPTLLNASGNTNFIFKVNGFNKSKLEEVNQIDSTHKLKDRLDFIYQSGGSLAYEGAEKDSMTYNLKMVDSHMPNIMGHILLAFYRERISSIKNIVDYIHDEGVLKTEIGYEDKPFLESKVKKLLVDVLLGFFAGTKWDGSYESNGTIIMKSSGDCLAFHIVDLDSLKNYLYNNIKLDTPSTTRHRFGKLYIEKNSNLYFKLNLQLRF
jgi:DNA (cytosine-5)-methyltransferase 1